MMRSVVFISVLLILCLTLATHDKQLKTKKNDFDRSKCKKIGFKKIKYCAKRALKCVKYGYRRKAFCAKKKQVCAKYKFSTIKKCKKYEKKCEEFLFKEEQECLHKDKQCIEYDKQVKKVCAKKKKVGCLKYATKTSPICLQKRRICIKRGFRKSLHCQRSASKCVEVGVKKGKKFCSKYTVVYKRGKRFCRKWKAVYKCAKYLRKKYTSKKSICTKKTYTVPKNKISPQKQSEKKKKSSKFQYYYPHKKQKVCVDYIKRHYCDKKVTILKTILTDKGFKTTAIKNKCEKYNSYMTNLCRKWVLKDRKICIKKVRAGVRCVKYGFTVSKSKKCMAYKRRKKYYCKRRETYCAKYGYTKKPYCKKYGRECYKYGKRHYNSHCIKPKMECVDYKDVEEKKCAQYIDVCLFTGLKINKSCKKFGKRCSLWQLQKQRKCALHKKVCDKLDHKKTKKYCIKYKPVGKCTKFEILKKPVCLDEKSPKK